MRLEIDAGSLAPAVACPSPDTRAAVPARRRIDRFELAVLAAFAATSVWVLAVDLWQVVFNGRVWTGTDGVYLVDQMQYLAWIRSASMHGLVANLFVLRSTPADYFQPAVAISGGLTALGMAPWLSLLLWKPVAVGACFWTVRRCVHRSLDGRWARRVALTLALFFGSLTILYGSVGVIGDLFPGFLSWGYSFGLIAIAAMVGALLAYQRARDGQRAWSWGAPLLGALASSLHPWNGELLILVVLGSELALWPGSRRGIRGLRQWLALPAGTVIATGAPLLYYAVLTYTDVSWHLAREASKHAFSLWSIVLAIAALLLPALLSYRRRPETFLAAAIRVWPVAAFAVFVVSATALGATPLHAFQGITIPLSILAVEGLQRAGFARLPGRILIGVLAVGLFTVPATAEELNTARKLLIPSPGRNSNFIAPDEHRALAYLARDPQPGGVFTRSYLGAVVPELTGRHTLVGDCLWSEPNCYGLTALAQSVFDGSLSPAAARKAVLASGARFVLADCTTTADLATVLGPSIRDTRRFGCAAVYELR